MPKHTKVWGVVFTEEGANSLRDFLKEYASEGTVGYYVYCSHVDMSQPYFHMVAESNSKFNAELYVPHHFVKFVITAKDNNP